MAEENTKYTFRKLAWLMVIILAVWLVYASLLYLLSDKWDHRGAFGDMFGAINALFSGLAFAGIIFTILLQREELKFQREELELTRKELTRTASAQEASQKELSKQADVLLKTAQINAMNTLIGVYQRILDARPGPGAKIRNETSAKLKDCQERIEDLLKKITPYPFMA